MVLTLLLAAASSGLIPFAAVFIAAIWIAANSFPQMKPIRKISRNVSHSAAVAISAANRLLF